MLWFYGLLVAMIGSHNGAMARDVNGPRGLVGDGVGGLRGSDSLGLLAAPNGQRDGKGEERKLPFNPFAFYTRAALLTAVDEYLADSSSAAAQAYGPIEDWDVSQIKGFGNLFASSRNPLAASFNADLSNWDVSSATTMERMFFQATSFTGNLCAWGSRIGNSTTVTDMFVGTSCPSPEDPDGTVGLPMGTFCETCGLPTGEYYYPGTVKLGGILSLNADGVVEDPAVTAWTFHIGGTFTTAADFKVVFVLDGEEVTSDADIAFLAGKVHWVVAGAVTLGANSQMFGLVTSGGDITLGGDANLIGSITAVGAISLGAGVTLVGPAVTAGAITLGAGASSGQLISTAGAVTLGAGANCVGTVDPCSAPAGARYL